MAALRFQSVGIKYAPLIPEVSMLLVTVGSYTGVFSTQDGLMQVLLTVVKEGVWHFCGYILSWGLGGLQSSAGEAGWGVRRGCCYTVPVVGVHRYLLVFGTWNRRENGCLCSAGIKA